MNIVPVDADVDETAPTVDDKSAAKGELSETSFTQEQGGVEMTLTYIYQGDRVVKQTTRNVIDYKAAGLGSKQEAQEILDPMVAEADDIQGYDQSIEYGETAATEEVSIDYEVIDLSQVAGLPGFEGSTNMADADFISFAESRNLLESQGFTEVE